jgi:long-chain acyl-CoA synthetase
MPNKYTLKELSRYKINTFADTIVRNSILYPEREAFSHSDKRLTFRQFNKRVNQLVNKLHEIGIKKGDIINILSWNCIEYAEIFGAAMKGGFIAAPLNTRLKANELSYLLEYSTASVLFVGQHLEGLLEQIGPLPPQLKTCISLDDGVDGMIPYSELFEGTSADEPGVDVNPDDPLVMVYTSGTTGNPKGALYTHQRKLRDAQRFFMALQLDIGSKNVLVVPLFHVAAISFLFAYFYAGASTAMMRKAGFDPLSMMETIQDEKATEIHIVPTQLVPMLDTPDIQNYDLSSLKRIWYAASPMPTELLKKGIAQFGPIFSQAYGLSESGPLTTYLNTFDHDITEKSKDEQKVLASCGQPWVGVQVRIVDDHGKDLEEGQVGEIIVKSDSVMIGYWDRPEETKDTMKDGWIYTGDLGYYDERAYIYIVSRKKDMIISGGENVYPIEVEEVLYKHPAVEEAAVIGIPDPYWVEKVHALVVLRKNEDATADDIKEYCKQNIAGYKAPKSVEIVDSLPKSPQGKILKKKLREKYEG